MEKLNLDNNTLKKFSFAMFFALCVISAILLLKHKSIFIWLYSLGVVFFLSGVFYANSLKLIYIIWMHFAYALNYINTRLILIIFFYLIFAPIGLAMRLFRIDLLDRKIEKDKQTYWKKKEEIKFNPVNYERRF